MLQVVIFPDMQNTVKSYLDFLAVRKTSVEAKWFARIYVYVFYSTSKIFHRVLFIGEGRVGNLIIFRRVSATYYKTIANAGYSTTVFEALDVCESKYFQVVATECLSSPLQ